MDDTDARSTLLIEGGAMRGIFAAGILDVFLERKWYPRRIAAISAGTLQALCYTARQIGRNRRINLTYSHDPRYMGLRCLLREGSYFSFRFMFGELAHRLEPFDWEMFARTEQELFAVVTDCRTGAPRFISSKEVSADDFMTVCEASCSIPLLSKPVAFGGIDYADGGVGMPLVPLPDELPFSAGKPVYILTRDIAYRKKPAPRMLRWAMEARYGKKYPAIVDGMCSIPERYNERLERLLSLEREGKVFIFRPEEPVTVSRAEKDEKKLDALYLEGRRIGTERFEEMRAWVYGT